MTYIKENWVNVSDPSNPPKEAVPIDATIMDKIEQGIMDAYTGIDEVLTEIDEIHTDIDDLESSLKGHTHNTEDIGAAPSSHTHNASDIDSGIIPVTRGGIGKTSVTSGSYLVGNGTGAMTEKTPSQVREHIGLGNVNNTSDANKPVSTAQSTAIADAKKAGTDAQSNLNSHTSNKSNPHGVTASQIGATRVLTGTYTGNGGTLTINLGVRPKAVLITDTLYGDTFFAETGTRSYCFGGLVIDGTPTHNGGLSIVSNGFKVDVTSLYGEGNYKHSYINRNGEVRQYIAWV